MSMGPRELLAVGVGCSLTVASMLAFARAPVAAANADAAVDAGGLVDAATAPPKPAADPKPLTTRERWLFDLRWQADQPRLVGVQRADSPTPVSTPRVFGRFALELYEGTTLIERVRFDFPLLGADDGRDAGSSARSALEKNLSTRIGVYFPHTPRGDKLELWDRKSERRWSLAWPPAQPTVDAGP